MIERASVLDVVSSLAERDTAVVLPTLPHAIAMWPVYRRAVEDCFDNRVHRTKTALTISGSRPRVLRLWVPYAREPTMPLDWEKNRQGFELISPYMRRDLGI